MHIRSKDTVVVITGKDKGKEGKVLVASPKTGKVVVEGVAIATKHQKPRQQGVPGGIVKKEAAIDASNVMLVCPKCKKGVRVGLHVNTAVRKPLPHIRALKPEIPLHMSKHHLNPALGNFQRLRQDTFRPRLKRHLKQQQPA